MVSAADTLKPQLVVLAAALALAAGCQSRPEALFERAQQALVDDDPESAARLFKEVTIADPDSPLAARAHFELAQMYTLRFRDVGAARDSLMKILTDYPDHPLSASARWLLARLYERELDAPAKALAQYEALREDALDVGSERELLLAVADCHYRLDELKAAAEAYRAALLLPYHLDTDQAYLRLATIEWIQGSPDESLRLLRELQARSASEEQKSEALIAEIELLTRLGRFEEATRALETAQLLFPSDADRDELLARIRAAERQEQSLEADGAALEALQETIRWGSGRRRRASRQRDPS